MLSRLIAHRRVLALAVVAGALVVLLVGSGPAGAYCTTLAMDGGCGEPAPYDNPSTLSMEVTAPKPYTTVSGTSVTVTANPGGIKNSEVNRVEFYVDGALFAIDVQNPWRADWNTLDQNLPAYDGQHQLTAIAYTTQGRATSPPVTVTVANTTGTKYRATFTSTPVPQAVEYNPAVTPQQAYPVSVTMTNRSTYTWSSATTKLSYRWFSPDAPPAVTDGALVSLGTSVAANTTRTVTVNVLPPTLPTGVTKGQYRLRIDLVEVDAYGNRLAWFSSKGNAPLENPVIDAKVLEAEALGLEKYYHYDGEELGAGMQHLLNVANGNSLLRWTPWQSPGRGLATVLDITYNSLEKRTESPLGNNFSIAISTLTRLGLPLDVHPNKADDIAGRANRWVEFVDADGTPIRFTGRQAADGTVYWEEPPGVHLYLRKISSIVGDPKTWAVTRPDRVTWYFDDQGYPSSVVDKNGNAITFTLENVAPADDPGGVRKRITRVTDAGGEAFVIDYYTKDEVKRPHMRGKIQSITDHGGHRLLFSYYSDGNLLKITQVGGSANGVWVADRKFVFTYTTSDGSGPAIVDPSLRVEPDPETANQSTRLFSVRDPRGNETIFTYYGPTSGQLRWRLKERRDRAFGITNYAYDLANRLATVTDPLGLATRYEWDTDGKVVRITNPKAETTQIAWFPDRNVQTVTEPTGAYREFAYDANGYLTDQWDALRNHSKLTYENPPADAKDVPGLWRAGRSISHISQLMSVTAPAGMATATPTNDYQTLFEHDASGNLVKLWGPEGHPSPSDPDGQFTEYRWNANGTLAQEIDANGHTTTFDYDHQGLITLQRDALGRETRFGYDADGSVTFLQDARHQGIVGGTPSHYQVQFFYDTFHRMRKQTSPKWYTGRPGLLIVSTADYDANDNVLSEVQPYYSDTFTRHTVTFDYDQMDRLTLLTGPDRSVDPSGERVARAYDAGGRLIKVTSPKGVPTSAPNDFAQTYTYDELNRVIREKRYETNASGTVLKELVTHYCYDLAGDLRSLTKPKADLAQVDCAAIVAGTSRPSHTTTYIYDAAHRRLSETNALGFTKSVAYDRNDNIIEERNELGFIATSEFDMRDLVIKRVVPVEPGTLATGDRKATTRTFYDAVGNQIKEVSPRGWDASTDKATFTKFFTTYEYDAADQIVRILLPRDPSDPRSSAQHYVHHKYDPSGQLEWTSLPVAEATPEAVGTSDKTIYTYYDTGWARTTKHPARQEATFDYTAEGWQSSRTPQGKPTQTWTHYPDGTVNVHTDSETKRATHYYDANNNLVRVDDQSGASGSETPIDVNVEYDSLDRRTKIVQKKQGKSFWVYTTMSYDLNGNILVREDDGRQDASSGAVTRQPRRNEFSYDGADWTTQQLDKGRQSGCDDDRKITSEYFRTSWLHLKKVYRGDSSCGWALKVDTTKDYFANGKLHKVVTKNGSGVVNESHTLSYLDASGFYANGNRTKDEFQRSKPGGGTCSDTTCTQIYTYDAQDRLVEWADGRGGTTKYTLDPHGNITRQEDALGSVEFGYDGDLLKTQSFGGVVQRRFWHDPSGNLDCVTRPVVTTYNCPQQGSDTQPPDVLEDWTYDGLERAKDTHNYETGDSAAYTYDAFDRLATEDEKHSGSAKSTTFEYLGLSGRVTTETQTGSSNATKDYSYDAWGNRVSLKATGGTTPGEWEYGYDAHGSVSMLLDNAGQAQQAYGYKPYGDQDEPLSSGIDVNPKNPINPYRYEAKRFDPGSGTLMMGARNFSPSIARFTQGDLFQGALDDFDLSVDPLTQNRYSLAGGNPVNFVEIDGHWPEFVDDAIDAVGDAASAAVDAVAGAARYCLGEGARTCAAVAGGVALVATGVGAAAGAGLIGGATLASAAMTTATVAEVASAGFSVASYRRTGDPMDLVNAGLSAVNAGGLGYLARQATRAARVERAVGSEITRRGYGAVKPGPYAREWIEATPGRATAAEQRGINAIGDVRGCHTCGVRTPGTRSGNWILDHQDATALQRLKSWWGSRPQRGFPQCQRCSNIQGGQVSQVVRRVRSSIRTSSWWWKLRRLM